MIVGSFFKTTFGEEKTLLSQKFYIPIRSLAVTAMKLWEETGLKITDLIIGII